MSRGSIAERVLGITDPSNHVASINQAHFTLTGEPYNKSHPAFDVAPTYAYNAWIESLPEDYRDRHRAMVEVESLVMQQWLPSATTFATWPVYTDMMRRYGKRADGSATALMIGALTSLSARSFVCLAEDVYGANRAVVVDPVESKDKARHGTFMHGSGLNLEGFKNESVDFIHTNQLFHMLIDPTGKLDTFDTRLRKLISEIGRVLAPGGQVLMKELIPDYGSFNLESEAGIRRGIRASVELGRRVGGILIGQGVNCEVLPALQMTDINFLFDPARDFFSYDHGINPVGFAMHGTKRG